MEWFEVMHLEGAKPNVVTFVSMLKVCGSMQAADRNTCFRCPRWNISQRDLVIGTNLLDMYVKYGIIVKAQEVFDNLLA